MGKSKESPEMLQFSNHPTHNVGLIKSSGEDKLT